MKNVAKKNILNISPYIPGKPIAEVQRELGLKSVVKLASNENPYGPSAKVRKAIAGSAKDINRYPDGNCFDLRQALARKLKVKPTELIFGNGSDEIIVMATRVFAGSGDEVIIARPSFLIYEIASKSVDAKIHFIPLKDFRYDLEGMKNAITDRTRIIFIANPDNPAGTYVSKKQVEDFLKGMSRDILVFFDEAYFEFVSKKDYPDTIGLVKEHKNIIVTRTFSKMYGLAGLRVGYGIADEELIAILERVREPFNVNTVAQNAAVAALKDVRYYQKLLKTIESEKQSLYRNFRKLNISFVESATNFILVDTGQDSKDVCQALLRKGVIVRDMGFWGLDTFIRVTIGKPEENKRFIQALEEIL